MRYSAYPIWSVVLAAAAMARTVPRSSSAPKRDTGTAKLVVAHHIVGLTGGGGAGDFTLDTWKQDIRLASAKGIDGFALNVGPDDYTDVQVGHAYVPLSQASERSATLPTTEPSYPLQISSRGRARRVQVVPVP